MAIELVKKGELDPADVVKAAPAISANLWQVAIQCVFSTVMGLWACTPLFLDARCAFPPCGEVWLYGGLAALLSVGLLSIRLLIGAKVFSELLFCCYFAGAINLLIVLLDAALGTSGLVPTVGALIILTTATLFKNLKSI